MVLSEWKPVMDGAVSVFAHEPAPVQIAIALAAALMITFMLEGLFINLYRRDRQRAPAAHPGAPPVAAPTVRAATLPHQPEMDAAEDVPPPAPFQLPGRLRRWRAREPAPVNRKRDLAAPRPDRHIRPQIRKPAGPPTRN